MLNQNSIAAVGASVWGEKGVFRKPLYDSYCFSRIPATVQYLLTGDESLKSGALPADTLGKHARAHKNVIVLLVDAFGWVQFDRHKDKFPLLKRIVKQGIASKVTSQFPSTTSAHLTTMHTGLPVYESGIFEWFFFDPAADDVIMPLMFSKAGETERETLLAEGLGAHDVFPKNTLYERLGQDGIESFIYQYKGYTPSTYSDHMFKGATTYAYTTLAEALGALGDEAMKPSSATRYFYLYADPVDMLCHKFGPDSKEVAYEAEAVCMLIEELLCKRLAGQADDTLLLITADHGHMGVDPSQTQYVNQLIPDIGNMLRRNKKGDILRFGGNRRDLFLYAKEEHASELCEKLKKALKGRAEVYLTADLIEQGFFGKPVQSLLDRLGNVAILPYAGEAVFWHEEGKFFNTERGSHGGLCPEEMETCFHVLPL